MPIRPVAEITGALPFKPYPAVPMVAKPQMNKLRALLLLARASNLPTVWSNCLAAWLLGGGGALPGLLLLCFAATLLYTGGMFLNDAFDAEFDRQFRPERPIPSGTIAERHVWVFGGVMLFGGVACLVPFGSPTIIFALVLVACILFYDAVHKRTMLSPLIMAACRVWLYLLAASTAFYGVNGLSVWSALALGCYIVGLSYIAKTESQPGPLRYWPCILLAAPVVVAWFANDGISRVPALALCSGYVAWTAWTLRHLFGRTKDIGAGVSGLLAGIVLVDVIAVAHAPAEMLATFAVLFAAARVFQKFVPAT